MIILYIKDCLNELLTWKKNLSKYFKLNNFSLPREE